MFWCLISQAALLALLALLALTYRPRAPDLTQVHPSRVLRGCLATGLLVMAAVIIGLALLMSQR